MSILYKTPLERLRADSANSDCLPEAAGLGTLGLGVLVRTSAGAANLKPFWAMWDPGNCRGVSWGGLAKEVRSASWGVGDLRWCEAVGSCSPGDLSFVSAVYGCIRMYYDNNNIYISIMTRLTIFWLYTVSFIFTHFQYSKAYCSYVYMYILHPLSDVK